MTTRIELELPGFPGFYESWLSQAVDHEESSWVEYRCDGGDSGPDYESDYPPELSLANDLASLAIDHTRYSEAYVALAQRWAEAFDYHAGVALGLSRPDTRRRWAAGGMVTESYDRPSLGLAFAEMTSPREYNFTTDRVFATLAPDVIDDLFARSAADDHATLAAAIRRRFTSRDGFRSFYSNDLAEWLEKPVAEWDINEMGTVLGAVLESSGVDMDSGFYDSGFYGDVFNDTVENEGAYHAWESAVNWPALEAARAEMRVEKLDEWLDDDPDAAREWMVGHPAHVDTMRENAADALAAVLSRDDLQGVEMATRCPDTLEMFA